MILRSLVQIQLSLLIKMEGILTKFDSGYKITGDYDETHSENDCDKCLKRVGKYNLNPVPFLLLMKNDKVHPDATRFTIQGEGNHGYRQYWCCEGCYGGETNG